MKTALERLEPDRTADGLRCKVKPIGKHFS